jgi:hemolysin activation/secretion protein
MRAVIASIILGSVSGVVLAQTVVPRPTPPTQDPSNLQPLQESTSEFRLPPLPPLAQQTEAAPLRSSQQLFVKQIRVEGVTAFKPAEIVAITGAYENRSVSSAELQSLRVALTRLYVDKGYVSSGVLLPDQEVKDGAIVYHAVEGSLARIELVGDPATSRRYVSGRIKRHIEEPLRVDDLQYALRYLEQDPNIARLDAALAPGDAPGESVLRLAVDDEPRFSLGLGADNHRSSSTGAEHGTVLFSTRNLTGYGEEFRAVVGISEGTRDGSAILSVPLTARNASLQLYYSNSDADIVEDAFEALDIQSESESRGVRLELPFVENLDTRFGVVLGFEQNSSLTTLLGERFSFSPGAQDGESRTAVAFGGLDFTRRGQSAVGALRLTYRQGIDALDATIFEPQSDIERLFNPTGADGLFTAYQAQATYVQRLNGIPMLRGVNDRAQFVFRTAAQISQDPLLSLEKFAIGGVNTVRGLPENLLVRDNGVTATLEFHVPIWGYRPDPHPANLAFVPFVDYGRSWDKVDTDRSPEGRDTSEARHVITSGLGMLWRPLRGLDVQLYWGKDIANNFEGDDPRDFRNSDDLQDDGFHFFVSYVGRW